MCHFIVDGINIAEACAPFKWRTNKVSKGGRLGQRDYKKKDKEPDNQTKRLTVMIPEKIINVNWNSKGLKNATALGLAVCVNSLHHISTFPRMNR